MAYQKISRDDLRSIAYSLQDFSDESETMSFACLLIQLTPENTDEINIEVARGFLIFGIESDVPGLMHAIIYLQRNENLGVNPDDIEDDQRLLDLCEFYDYVQTSLSTDDIEDFYWTETELEKITHDLLKNMVEREPKLFELKSAAPDFEILRGYVKKIITDYKTEQAQRFSKNPERIKEIELMQFIYRYCQDQKLVELDFGESEIEEKVNNSIIYECDDMQIIEEDVYLGLLLFVVMRIDFERGLVGRLILPPAGTLLTKGSKLYKDCLNLLNVRHISELGFNDRIQLLKQLSMFIGSVTLTEETDRIISQENMRHFKEQINQYIESLKTQVKLQPIIKDVSNWIAARTPTIAPCVGRGMMTWPIVSQLVTYGMWASCAVPLQIILFVYSNKISNKLFYRIEAANLTESAQINELSKTMLRYYMNLMQKTSKAVGYSVERFARIVLSVGTEGIKELYNYIDEDDRKLFIRYINKVLELPSTICSAAGKARIERVLGLKPGQKLEMEMREISTDPSEWVDLPSSSSPSLKFKRL